MAYNIYVENILQTSATVTEGDTVRFWIHRTNAASAETLLFSTRKGTATYDEGDYETTNGNEPADIALTLGAGIYFAVVDIDVNVDNSESNGQSETFGALLYAANGSTQLASLPNSAVTILDAPQSLPNLTISDVDVGNQDISNREDVDAPYAPGDVFTVSVDIENEGSGAAGSSALALYLVRGNTASVMDTNSTNALSAGSSDTNENLSFVLPDDLSAGQYELLLKTDYDDRIDESDEGDNIQSFFINVVGNADPTASGHDQSVEAGDAIPLATLFSFDDPDGSVVSFTVTDATSGGGHFYHNGALASSGTWGQIPNEIPISEIGEWSFVAGPNGSVDTLRFTATDNDGGWNRTAAIAKVTATGGTQPVNDTVPNDTGTSQSLLVGQTITGLIDGSDLDGTHYDADYFHVTLTGGRKYTFSADATVVGNDTLDEVFIRLRDADGNKLSVDISDEDSSAGFTFNTPGHGDQPYYFAISAGGNAWLDATGEYEISLADDGAATPTNYIPWAKATDFAKLPGKSVPLSEMFEFGDPNGLSDIVSFAVQDRSINGGYLTYKGQAKVPNTIYERPIGEIDDWAFVAGSSATDYVGFNAIDSQGNYNSSVIATISTKEDSDPKKSADELFGQNKLSVLSEFSSAAYVDNFEKIDDLRKAGWNVLTEQNYREVGLEEKHAIEDYYIYDDPVQYLGGIANALTAKSQDNNSLIIAFAGSDEPADFVTDVVDINAQFPLFAPLFDALEVRQWLESGKEIIATGHSLGAAMAQAFVQTYEKFGSVYGVGFANPGLNLGDLQDSGITAVDERLEAFTSLVITKDPVKTLGEARGYELEGDVFYLSPLLQPLNQFGPADFHRMETYIQAIGSISDFAIFSAQNNNKSDEITKAIALDYEALTGGGGGIVSVGSPEGAFVTPDGVTPGTQDFQIGADGNWTIGTNNDDLSKLTIDTDAFTKSIWNISDVDGNVLLRNAANAELLKVDGFGSLEFNASWADLDLTIDPLVGTDILNNTIYFNGGIGDDVVRGQTADRRIVAQGGDGNDQFFGGSPNDRFTGQAGHDDLWGGGGNDVLIGGKGGDVLSGGSGKDSLHGGGGNDWLMGGSGSDLLNGAGGKDFFVYYGSNSISIDLRSTKYQKTGEGRDKLVSIEGVATDEGKDALKGNGKANYFLTGDGADRLFGRSGSDRLEAGTGGDKLFGGKGNDLLKGDKGADLLVGGKGNDELIGGPGTDTFRFSKKQGKDVVKDFRDGRDVLDLSGFGFKRKKFAFDEFYEIGGRNNDVVGFSHKGTTIKILGMDLKDLDNQDILI